jgi:cell division septum initiation protein DivIVA
MENTTNRTHPGRPSKYSAEQVEQVRTMLTSGATLRATAEATGVPEQSVMYYKKKFGLKSETAAHGLSTEQALIANYDTEIEKLKAVIETATTRLRETTTKRRRVARALGLISEEVGTSTSEETDSQLADATETTDAG